jgi:hypothetical protein
LECLAFGLSEACRLKVVRRGGMDHKRVVQRRSEESWVDVDEVGLLFFPFWARKEERYLQNRLIGA